MVTNIEISVSIMMTINWTRYCGRSCTGM